MKRNLDKFDKFLRSRLIEDPIKAEGWNEPSTDIFDNAMNKVNQTEKEDDNSGLFPIIFLILGLLLIGSLAYIYYLNSELNGYKINSEQQYAQLEKKYQEQSIQIKEMTSIYEKGNTNIEASKPSTSPLTSKIDNSTSQELRHNPWFKKTSLIESSLRNYDNNKFELKQSPQSIIDQNDFQSIKNSSFPSTLSLTERIPYTTNSVKTIKSTIHSKEKIESIPLGLLSINTKNPNLLSNWSIGINSNALISTLHMTTEDQGQNFTLTDYDKWYIKYGLNGFVQYDINSNWAGLLSLGYNVYENKSHFQESTQYDINKEFSNGLGELMYLTDVNIYTPVGVHKTSMEFKTDNSHAHGDEMINKTKIKQTIAVASLGTGIQYSLQIAEKTKLNINGGLGFHQVIALDQKYIMQMYMDDKMMNETTELSSTKNELNNNFVTVNGGLGVNYKLNSILSLNAGINYEHGVTPAVQQLNGIPSKTFLKSVNVGLGVQVRL